MRAFWIALVVLIAGGATLWGVGRHNHRASLFLSEMSHPSGEALKLETGLTSVSSKILKKDLLAEKALKNVETLKAPADANIEVVLDKAKTSTEYTELEKNWGAPEGKSEIRFLRWLKTFEFIGPEVQQVVQLQNQYQYQMHQDVGETVQLIEKAMKKVSGDKFSKYRAHVIGLASEFSEMNKSLEKLAERDLQSKNKDEKLTAFEIVIRSKVKAPQDALKITVDMVKKNPNLRADLERTFSTYLPSWHYELVNQLNKVK